MSPDERAELERYRREAARGGAGRGWARGGRWLAATALLLVAAVLTSLAVVATYLRSEVLDADTYVETVTALAEDPVVRSAIAARLTEEIVTRSDIEGLLGRLADHLEAQAPPVRSPTSWVPW